MPIPESLASGIISIHAFVNTLFSTVPWYFPGQGNDSEEMFEGNDVSQSEIRL